jgi:hypothetical protein
LLTTQSEFNVLRTIVLGEIKVNLVLASSTKAGIINQSSNQIRRNTTLFSLAQRRSINLYYPSYEVTQPYARMPAMLHKYGMPSETCNSIYISYAELILASLQAKTIRLEKVGCFGFRSQGYSENHLSNISIGFHDRFPTHNSVAPQKKKKKERKKKEKRRKKGLISQSKRVSPHRRRCLKLCSCSAFIVNIKLSCLVTTLA